MTTSQGVKLDDKVRARLKALAEKQKPFPALDNANSD